jgi:hypothetical protein
MPYETVQCRCGRNHYDSSFCSPYEPYDEDTEIVITIGFASQTHWITIIRQFIARGYAPQVKPGDITWAESIFKFGLHPFYKKGGVGPIPRKPR